MNIFEFVDIKEYIRAKIDFETSKNGRSYRYFARKAGFNSSNYIQILLSEKRRMNESHVKALADSFALVEFESEYFLKMFHLSTEQNTLEQEQIKAEMQRLATRQSKTKARSESFFSSWVIQVIWEMARIPGIRIHPDIASSSLKGRASVNEVRTAIDYLVLNGFLHPTDEPDVYEQKPIALEPLNDKRRLELQDIHKRFLEMAKHRLNDDIKSREFQSLTVAVPVTAFEEIRNRMRSFIGELNAHVSDHAAPEEVVHISCSAFKVVS